MATGERGAEVERTYPELLTKLRSQVGFLERSAAHFDAGHEDEGEQLAARARVSFTTPATRIPFWAS